MLKWCHPCLLTIASHHILPFWPLLLCLCRDEETNLTNRGQQRTSSISGTGTVSLQQPASNRAGFIAASRNDGNAAERVERESFISDVPKWIEVEHLPWKERCEIHLYKLVALVPVSVTFCLYFYLFIYYSVVSGTLGFGLSKQVMRAEFLWFC